MTLVAVADQTEPQPRVVSGVQALDDVEGFLRRFLAFPSPHAFVAVTLWIAHTWYPKAFYVSPRLIADSAEPGSGKTRLLELLNLLCSQPELMISATTAAIFRLLDEQPHTLLFDEVDAIFNPKSSGNNEDLRALLNSGYKRGAKIARCVGDAKSMKVQRFEVYAPVALAGLAGNMPNTITTRAIVIHMRRRGPGEVVEQFRERDAEVDREPIRNALANWMDQVGQRLATARPAMPAGVVDRPAELWETLLSVADEAGGEWPNKAREACKHFVLGSGPDQLSLGVRLLGDVREVFTIRDDDGRCCGMRDNLPTQTLVDALIDLDESRWADLYGKPLNSTRLAKELRRYDVEPTQYKVDGVKHRGYLMSGTNGLLDAWSRYLPAVAGTGGTAGTDQLNPVPGPRAVPG